MAEESQEAGVGSPALKRKNGHHPAQVVLWVLTSIAIVVGGGWTFFTYLDREEVQELIFEGDTILEVRPIEVSDTVVIFAVDYRFDVRRPFPPILGAQLLPIEVFPNSGYRPSGTDSSGEGTAAVQIVLGRLLSDATAESVEVFLYDENGENITRRRFPFRQSFEVLR